MLISQYYKLKRRVPTDAVHFIPADQTTLTEDKRCHSTYSNTGILALCKMVSASHASAGLEIASSPSYQGDKHIAHPPLSGYSPSDTGKTIIMFITLYNTLRGVSHQDNSYPYALIWVGSHGGRVVPASV